MEKEIRKVKIGMDGIKTDSCIFKGNISLFVITFFAILFFGWITISVFQISKDAAFYFTLVVLLLAWGIIGIMVSVSIKNIYEYLHNLSCIKKGKITVKKLKIIDTKHYHIRKSHRTFYKMHFPEKIIFQTNDEDQTYYYKWVMSDEKPSVFGAIGDEYYLIFLGKNKNPSMIYNTRYFYIEGDENE